LDTDEQVWRAAAKLEALKDDLMAWNPHEMELRIENVDHFFHNCLYAKVVPNQKFLDFGNFLRTKVDEMGIDCRDVYDFVPHMTLLKLPRQKFKENHTRYFDSRIFTAYLGEKFGTQSVDNIHLCSMSDNRSADGFYECAQVIKFP
jgi:2'-5' RNA ligase